MDLLIYSGFLPKVSKLCAGLIGTAVLNTHSEYLSLQERTGLPQLEMNCFLHLCSWWSGTCDWAPPTSPHPDHNKKQHCSPLSLSNSYLLQQRLRCQKWRKHVTPAASPPSLICAPKQLWKAREAKMLRCPSAGGNSCDPPFNRFVKALRGLMNFRKDCIVPLVVLQCDAPQTARKLG